MKQAALQHLLDTLRGLSRPALMPRSLAAMCAERLATGERKFGDRWKADNLEQATIEEIADTINYTTFARLRGASRILIWAIQATAGLQYRLARRALRNLPVMGDL